MSISQIQCQPAFLLHQHPYRESSLIIDVLTRDHGRYSLLAKGVKSSKYSGLAVLRAFQPLSISFTGKSDLKTLTHAEMLGKSCDLRGLALYCGYYVNELIQHFLHKHDPHPEIFEDYQACLLGLHNADDIELTLRCFELNLMEKIGYGLNFSYDNKHQKAIDSTKKYSFNNEYGLVEDAQGSFAGFSLIEMQARHFDHQQVRVEAKMLMRMVIDNNLQGKQLKSRLVINNIVKRLNHE